MIARLGQAALAVFLVLGSAAACTETDGPPISSQVKEQACPTGSARRQSVAKDIITAFYTCCDGSAHWIPDFLVPKDFRAMLESGPGGSLCVPDEFSTDANYTPARCTSLFEQPGACMSSCIPQVRNAPVKLPKDICPGNQLCAPCIDPTTNQPTGACNQGAMACDPPEQPSEECKDFPPTLDLSEFPPCGPRAHCAPEDRVPEKDKPDLGRCADGVTYCVPDEFLKRGGRYTPPSCKSVGGREGRCLSTAAPKIDADKANLPVDSCNPVDERCVPCYDPRTGMGTGACAKGWCEKGPVEPPRAFEACGSSADGKDAFCVPAALLPPAELKNFDALGCRKTPCSEAGTVCVPKKVIDAGTAFKPKQCKNSLTGFLAGFMSFFKNPFDAISKMKEYSDGRCLSKCLAPVRPSAKLLGSSKDCDADEVCVPCFDPQKLEQGKVPTGACDR